MKKFIKRTLIFVLPILIFVVSLEIILRHIPNDYSYKKAYLDEHSKEIEILFLGSSHTYYGINPQFFGGNCFNASHVSQTLNFDWEIIKKYKNELDHLKYIVIPVDYFTFYLRLENGIENWRVKNYLIYYNINTGNKFSDYFEITNGKFKDNLNRAFRYFKKHDYNDITCNKLGFGTVFNLSTQDLVSSGKEAALKHTISSNKYFNENVSVLNNIISFAKSRNIQVVLFTSPAFKSYVEHLNAQQLNTTIARAMSIAQSNSNVKYYNFLKDSSFTNTDFYDADHLSQAGAKKFSLKMDSLILMQNNNNIGISSKSKK